MLSTTEMRNLASDETALAWSIQGVDLDSKDNFGNPVSAPVLMAQEDVPETSRATAGLGKHQTKALDVLRGLIADAETNTQGHSIAHTLASVERRHAGCWHSTQPRTRTTRHPRVSRTRVARRRQLPVSGEWLLNVRSGVRLSVRCPVSIENRTGPDNLT